MEEHAKTLARLESEIATRDQPGDLLALAQAIDDLGRELATELGAAQPEHAAALKAVLLQVPAVHTRALLRAAEKLDDAGSPRRAARVLIEALRKAFDANLVEGIVDALHFMLDAFAQRTATAKLHSLMISDPAESRRERRARYLAAVDELPALIDWNALDDELGFD